MKLRQLHHFVAVAQSLNFRRAAEQVHLSQQAISKSLIQLEAQLGVRLLERGKQSVALTQQGLHLLPHALEVIAAARRFDEAVAKAVDGSSGSLALGATPTMLASVVPKTLTQFQQQFPHTPVTIERGDFSSLCVLMQRGELDLILSTEPGEIPRHLVRTQVVGADRNVVVVRAGHPLAGQSAIPCGDLLAYPQVVTLNYQRGAAYNQRLFASADLVPPRAALSVGSTLLAMERVEHSDAWWIAPHLMVKDQVASGRYALLPVSPADNSWDLIIAMRRHASPSRWMSAFASLAEAAIGQSRAEADN